MLNHLNFISAVIKIEHGGTIETKCYTLSEIYFFFFSCKNSKTLSKFNPIVITTSVFFIIVNILDVKSNPCLAGCNLPLYYCGTFEGLGFHIYLEQNQIWKLFLKGNVQVPITLLRGDLVLTRAELLTVYKSWCVESKHAIPLGPLNPSEAKTTGHPYLGLHKFTY